MVRLVEFASRPDVGGGVDFQHTGAHDVRFFLTDGLYCCVDLTVEVGNVNRVGIDEQEMTDPGTAKRLGGKGADAADPEYGDAGRRELCETVPAEEKPGP